MLAQKLILSFSSKIVNKVLQLAGTIIVARYAGPDVLGTVAFGLAYVSVFGFIADLGTGTAHMKLIADGEDRADANTTYATLRLILIFSFVVIVLVYYLINHYAFGYEFETAVHRTVVILSLGMLVITQLISIAVVFFNSNIQQARQDVPEFVKTVINQSLRITVVLLGYGAIAIAISSIAALLLVTPIYIYFIRKFAFGSFNKKLAKKYMSISLPLIVVVAVNSLVSFGDKLILESFSNTEEVGYYVAGYRLSGVVLMIAGSIGLIFFPTFSRLIKDNDYDSLNSHIRKFEGFSYSFIFPFVLALVLFSKPLVLILLGDAYINSTNVLSIITFSLFIFTVVVPYGNVITGNGRFDRQAQLAVVKGIVFVTSAYILLYTEAFAQPSLSMAVAVFITYITHALLIIISAKKIAGQVHLFRDKRIPIFGLAYTAAFWWLLRELQIEGNYRQLIFLFIFLMGYWLLGSLFRVIRKEEWSRLNEIGQVKKLLGYIRSEFKKEGKDS